MFGVRQILESNTYPALLPALTAFDLDRFIQSRHRPSVRQRLGSGRVAARAA
jgi:hypothetical protein